MMIYEDFWRIAGWFIDDLWKIIDDREEIMKNM